MVTQKHFGKTKNGEEVILYTLDSGKAAATISNLGATLVSFFVPDKDGIMTDICLGFDKAEDYDNFRDTYFGATVGRFANRIKGGKFTLGGKEYILPKNNNGRNCLHGGTTGFSFRPYDVQISDNSVTMSIISPDGEDGFPGNLSFSVRFTLEDTALSIEYFAESDKDTVVTFTNHAYFNLNGAESGKDALNQTLWIDADAYGVVDSDAMFTGLIRPVKDTPYDFKTPTLLSSRLPSEHPDLKATEGGIDNFFVSKSARGELYHLCTLACPDNKISLDCETDQIGVQIYTAKFVNEIGKGGTKYGAFSGVCLETGGFADAPNLPYVPSPLLKAGDKYYSKTVYTAQIK